VNPIITYILLLIAAITAASCGCTQKECLDNRVVVTIHKLTIDDVPCSDIFVTWSSNSSDGEGERFADEDGNTYFELLEPPEGQEPVNYVPESLIGIQSLQLEIYCDASKIYEDSFPVEWETYVCNECTGPEDDMATTGHVYIELEL